MVFLLQIITQDKILPLTHQSFYKIGLSFYRDFTVPELTESLSGSEIIFNTLVKARAMYVNGELNIPAMG